MTDPVAFAVKMIFASRSMNAFQQARVALTETLREAKTSGRTDDELSQVMGAALWRYAFD
jgi:hypothetical protein